MDTAAVGIVLAALASVGTAVYFALNGVQNRLGQCEVTVAGYMPRIAEAERNARAELHEEARKVWTAIQDLRIEARRDDSTLQAEFREHRANQEDFREKVTQALAQTVTRQDLHAEIDRLIRSLKEGR